VLYFLYQARAYGMLILRLGLAIRCCARSTSPGKDEVTLELQPKKEGIRCALETLFKGTGILDLGFDPPPHAGLSAPPPAAGAMRAAATDGMLIGACNLML